jgi:tRNA(His) 5'-end guanylyltransferase
MKDALGERMKENYENRTRIYLPRRTYTLLRIDGKAFHTYTKGFKRPFDEGFVNDMNQTAIYLCKNIQGAKFAFVASDEISILVTDFETPTTDMWFDGNIQKITSISASIATAKFNQLRFLRVMDMGTIESSYLETFILDSITNMKLAEFDSRVWTIPSRTEVVNYFIWRQQDTVRNSISSCAQSLYSHKELNGKSQDDMQEMCFQKGLDWNAIDPKLKRGRFIMKKEVTIETPVIGEEFMQTTYTRNKWVVEECPTFTQDKDFLLNLIPILE